MKKLTALALALALSFAMLAGCTAAPGAGSPTPAGSPSPPEAAKKVLLVISFGTSYNDSRDATIGAIETALQTAYPEYEMRRAFTSQIIIDKLASRDGLVIDNVEQAMDRLVADGVTDVVIQPTHVMCGFEYDDVVAETAPYKDKFDSFKMGEPLLISDADYAQVVSAITAETGEYAADGTAIVFMGHGTEHKANATYEKLRQSLFDAGYGNYLIGTVEAEPTLDDVIGQLRETGATKVVLLPLMIVAGDHANNDMAGDEEDSWKSVLEAEGFEVECVLKGLGQYAGIRQMFVAHAAAAMKKGAPVYAGELEDGEYVVDVSSGSSMFRVIYAVLTVKDGEMRATITLSGQGYEKLYMGTGEQALADTDDKCVYFVENANGKYTYTIPVEALDMEIDCAAWSIRKQEWYDRVLVFSSALKEVVPDGVYTAGVTLAGGSGRAAVDSPATVTVSGGEMTATLVWSSPNYTYMLVGDERYDPVNTEGNATFEIPVVLDSDIPVSAETTAMSAPRVVDYVLRIDGASLTPAP